MINHIPINCLKYDYPISVGQSLMSISFVAISVRLLVVLYNYMELH